MISKQFYSSLLCLAVSFFLVTKVSAVKPSHFINVPAGSKVTFMKNLNIPANEVMVPLGSYKDGQRTECTLFMAASDSAERMIPAGTQFEVLDTKQEFNQRSDLILKSNSIRTISCTSLKGGINSGNIISESDAMFTRTSQAQRAMGGKVKLDFPKSPKLVKD